MWINPQKYPTEDGLNFFRNRCPYTSVIVAQSLGSKSPSHQCLWVGQRSHHPQHQQVGWGDAQDKSTID